MDSTELANVEYHVVTHYIYDGKTGDILVSHRHSILSGQPRPGRQHDEATMLREAAQQSGRPEKSLAILTLDGVERVPGAMHKVDVHKKTLINVINPKHIRQA